MTSSQPDPRASSRAPTGTLSLNTSSRPWPPCPAAHRSGRHSPCQEGSERRCPHSRSARRPFLHPPGLGPRRPGTTGPRMRLVEARPEGAGPSSGLLLPPEWALPAAEEPPTAGPPQHLRVRMRVTHHQGQAQAGRGPCGQGRESLCWSRPPRHRGSCSAGGPVSASAGASAVGLFESARLSYLSVTPVLQRGALRPRGPDTCPGRPGGGGAVAVLEFPANPPSHPLLPPLPRRLSSTWPQGPVHGPSYP